MKFVVDQWGKIVNVVPYTTMSFVYHSSDYDSNYIYSKNFIVSPTVLDVSTLQAENAEPEMQYKI